MSIGLSWYIEDHIILLAASGDVNTDEIHQTMEKVATLIEQSNADLVHLIIDLNEAAHSALSIKARVEAVRPALSHPRCGWVILVGQKNPVANFVSSTTAQIFKTRFRSFPTIEEGLEFLKDMVPNLPEFPTELSDKSI